MKPTIGRNVTVIGLESNGSREHPAVVTRVFDKKADTIDGAVKVNLTVFPDGAVPRVQTSVDLYDTREAAMAGQSGDTDIVAHWPSREGSTEPGA